jgi:hypothetical protein
MPAKINNPLYSIGVLVVDEILAQLFVVFSTFTRNIAGSCDSTNSLVVGKQQQLNHL